MHRRHPRRLLHAACAAPWLLTALACDDPARPDPTAPAVAAAPHAAQAGPRAQPGAASAPARPTAPPLLQSPFASPAPDSSVLEWLGTPQATTDGDLSGLRLSSDGGTAEPPLGSRTVHVTHPRPDGCDDPIPPAPADLELPFVTLDPSSVTCAKMHGLPTNDGRTPSPFPNALPSGHAFDLCDRDRHLEVFEGDPDPNACPPQTRRRGDRCVCTDGKVMAHGKACCWPGQTLYAQPGGATQCYGAPTSCPEGSRPGEHACVRRAPRGMAHVPAGTSWTGPFSLQENYDLAFSPVSHCATDLHLQLGYNPVMIDLPGFFIDRREVTVSEYDACVRAGACTPAPRGPEFNSGKKGRGAHPVDGVSSDQAIAYCAWKNKRLPSSDEWEKAARGFYGRRFVTGHDRPTCDDVRWRGCPGEPSTTPAGKNPRDVSAFGVHDMTGNVAEWTTYVEDGLNDEYRARGGAIDSYDVDSLQAHYIEGSDHTGIRCARDAR